MLNSVWMFKSQCLLASTADLLASKFLYHWEHICFLLKWCNICKQHAFVGCTAELNMWERLVPFDRHVPCYSVTTFTPQARWSESDFFQVHAILRMCPITESIRLSPLGLNSVLQHDNTGPLRAGFLRNKLQNLRFKQGRESVAWSLYINSLCSLQTSMPETRRIYD